MEINYTYTPSGEYIGNLTFAYLETYSFQRGREFEENLKLTTPEYGRLKTRKERRNNLSPAEEVRFLELHGLLGFTQYIINDRGSSIRQVKRQTHLSLMIRQALNWSVS